MSILYIFWPLSIYVPKKRMHNAQSSLKKQKILGLNETTNIISRFVVAYYWKPPNNGAR